MAPPNSNNFSVRVVLPASGCAIIAKVRRRETSVSKSAIMLTWQRINDVGDNSHATNCVGNPPQSKFRGRLRFRDEAVGYAPRQSHSRENCRQCTDFGGFFQQKACPLDENQAFRELTSMTPPKTKTAPIICGKDMASSRNSQPKKMVATGPIDPTIETFEAPIS